MIGYVVENPYCLSDKNILNSTSKVWKNLCYIYSENNNIKNELNIYKVEYKNIKKEKNLYVLTSEKTILEKLDLKKIECILEQDLIKEPCFRRAVSSRQCLSETFISKNKQYLDWPSVWWKQKLSETFIVNNLEDVKWENLSSNRNINFYDTFLLKYIKMINWVNFLNTHKVSISVLTSVSEYIISCNTDYSKEEFWVVVSSTQTLNFDYINRYSYYLDMSLVCRNMHLPESLLEQNYNKIDKDVLVETQILSIDFLERHIDDLDCDLIIKYQDITDEFVSEHLEKIDLYEIFISDKISETFKKEYQEELIFI